MKKNTNDLTSQSLRLRKLRDIAWVLPLLGIFLFLTPLPAVFALDETFLGVPLVFTFFCVTWLSLIVGCARLSAKLSDASKE